VTNPIKVFINRLFKKQSLTVNEATTAPLTEQQIREIAEETHRYQPPQLLVGSGRDVGLVRNNNEDSLFTFIATMATEKRSLPFGIFIVADGMGGHQNGEIASEKAVRAMSTHIIKKLYTPLFGIQPHPPQESLQEIMEQGVLEAHRAVMRNAPGGGSTLTAVLVLGNQMTVAHLGDSRAYVIQRDGRMQAVTRDHSLVRRLEELGQITPEEAAVHPQKAMLYRALGQGEPSEPDISNHSFPHPGYVLICSDGLWNVVPEDKILRIINGATDLNQACADLIEAANAMGGPDNVAVIIVSLSD